jgi:hypothetical protein
MNSRRYIIFGFIVFLALFFLAMPDPQIGEKLQTAEFPWNITLHEDGSSEVFSLKPGISTLQDVQARFHEAEAIAIYHGQSQDSLEAYFDTIKIGPLEAKLVITLNASKEELEQMLERARGIALSGDADRKIKLSSDDQLQALQRTISGITFIPKYSGLDSDFIKERFGEPAAWLRLNENAVQYFYPDKGLSILIDAKGKEVLEYKHPAQFILPPDAVNSESDTATGN